MAYISVRTEAGMSMELTTVHAVSNDNPRLVAESCCKNGQQYATSIPVHFMCKDNSHIRGSAPSPSQDPSLARATVLLEARGPLGGWADK